MLNVGKPDFTQEGDTPENAIMDEENAVNLKGKGLHMSQLTKKALAASLRKLLQTRPLDKITIQDLTDDCGISRSAFYYHFQDIYDLLQWTAFNRFAEAVGEQISSERNYESLHRALELLYEDRQFIHNILPYVDFDMLEKYVSGHFRKITAKAVDENAQGLAVTDRQKQSVVHFYQLGILGYVYDWVVDGMKESIDDMTENIRTIMNGTIRHSLEEYDRKNSVMHTKTEEEQRQD